MYEFDIFIRCIYLCVFFCDFVGEIINLFGFNFVEVDNVVLCSVFDCVSGIGIVFDNVLVDVIGVFWFSFWFFVFVVSIGECCKD